MSDNTGPDCRLCGMAAMQAVDQPANRDSIRAVAWILVALGLGIGTFSQGSLVLILGGLILAAVAFPLTDDRLIHVWACTHCDHRFPRFPKHGTLQVQYKWRPIPVIIAIAAILIIGTGFWPVIILLGYEVTLFGPMDPALEKIRIALGYGVLVAIAIVFFEGLDRYNHEPFIWRAMTVLALLLGLGTTANAAVISIWIIEGVDYEWLQLLILIIGEATVLTMAMHRSRLFVRPLQPDESVKDSFLTTS